jgi:predicted O-methyltransferase YrrM
MNFTQDWFTYNIPHLEKLVGMLNNPSSILEIGCFEGRATCWFLEHAIPNGGSIICVDPFTGSMEHDQMDLSDLYTTFIGNVSEVEKSSQTVSVYKEYSYTALGKLISNDEKFDLIYIDGSHTAYDVLTDACMSWGLLKQGGIMVFDDYHWRPDGYTDQQTPKLAVDVFSHVFKGQFTVVHDGYQIAIQKS